mgnify:CR=1 FL=1
MFKIAGILIKDRVRRMKKTIECHKILMFFAVVGLISCIYTTSLQDILFLKKYLIYVTWISMLYLGLKIMNPTQEAIIDYQLIELKLITRQQFKLLIGMKLYGVGTIIAIILKIIDEAYTILFALLSINGILEVLIICIPTRLETTPYENQIVWKIEASLIPSINQIEAKTIISKIELKGPINNMKCFKLLMFHFLGSFKYSISTLSKGKVN